MKKLILTLLLAALAMTAALPATAEEPLLGGWTVYPDEPAKIPEEVSEAFAQAVKELTGCDYEPVALLAQQVVAGMNLLPAVQDDDRYAGCAAGIRACVSLLQHRRRERDPAD